MALCNVAKSFVVIGATALLTLPAIDRSLSAPPPRITGGCSPTNIRYVLSARGTTTAANGVLVNIAEAALTFTQAKRGCVIVDFTAFAQVTDATKDAVVVRATLTPSGGSAFLGRPSDARFQPANTNFDTRTVQFVFADVTPGTYTVRMRMTGDSATATDTVVVSSPNMVVHYN